MDNMDEYEFQQLRCTIHHLELELYRLNGYHREITGLTYKMNGPLPKPVIGADYFKPSRLSDEV